MLGDGNIGVDVSTEPKCTMALALNTNKQKYFVHKNRDPCGNTTDAIVKKYCFSSRKFNLFRTHSGECNNPDNLRWGSVYSRLSRLLPRVHGKINMKTYDKALKGIFYSLLKIPNGLQTFSLYTEIK